MNIHKLVEKAIVLVSSMSLLLQSFSPFAFFIPTKINAQESLKAEVDFNTSNNTFIVKVNNKDANTTGSVDYALTYRTDTQNEAIKGTSDKELKDNFQKDFYAGTCSSNGTCISHIVLRGILKVKIQSQNWITAQKFAIDDGKLKVVSEEKPILLDLSDNDNFWLEHGIELSPTPIATLTPTGVPTPTITATITPTPTVTEQGQILDGISTSAILNTDGFQEKDYEAGETVKTGVFYKMPFNNKLGIKFTKLQKNSGTLAVNELFLSLNITTGRQVGDAYDITSSMKNGSFLYDLTLPLPVDSKGYLDGTNVKEENAQVSYSEDGVTFIIAQNEKQIDKKNHTITLKNVDHFTTYFISADTNAATGTGAYTANTGPEITETVQGKITTGTLILNIPSGFVFNTGSNVTASVGAATSGSCSNTSGGNKVLELGTSAGASSQTSTPTTTTITFNVKTKSKGNTCKITFSGIQVRPTVGNPLASGDISISGTASISSATLTSATLTEVAGAVKAGTSTVVASPTTIPPDGSTTSTITVTLKDNDNNPVSGKTVTLAKTSGPGTPTITTVSGTTNASGVASFTVKSTTVGTDVFTATDTTDGVTVTQTASVSFTDSSPPTTPGTPSTSSPTSNSKPTWNWTASTDDVGVDHYIFYWDTVAGGTANNSGNLATNTFTHSSTLADGTWYGKVKAFDAAGNSSSFSGNGSVVIDTSPPTLISTHISSNNTNSNLAKVGDIVTVVFTSSENINTPTVTIAGHSASVTGSNASWSGNFTMTSGDTEGAIPFTIDFSDLASNPGTQVTVTSDSSSVTFDKTGPTTSFDSTPASPTNSTSVSFSFHSNEGGSTFECKLDSGTFSSCSSPKGYSSLGDGLHTFNVRATDPAGNTGDSSTFLWTIDATAPNDPTNVQSTSHTTNTPSTNDVISMEWVVATDNSGGTGVDGYGYTFDNSSSWICDLVKLLSGSVTTVASSSLADGSWYFHICTKDNAGNWTSTAHAGPFIIDKTPPVLQSFSSTKTNGTYGSGTVINVTASFNETLKSISSITVVLDTGASVILNTVSGSNIAGNYTVGVTGSGENSSDLTVSSISSTNAVDLAGNPHTGTALPASNIADTSNIVVDTTAPTLSSVHLSSDNSNSSSLAKVGDTVTLTFASSETVTTPTVTIAGHSVTPTNTSGNNWSASYTMVSGDTEGSISFTVDYSDSVGNSGSQVSSTTDASSVTFDKTAPTTSDSGIDTFWHNTDVTVILNCSDGTGSGCSTTYHTINGTTPTTSSLTGNPFTLTADGEYTVKYFSVDAAGNQEEVKTATNTVKIDKTKPVDPSVTSSSHSTSTWSTDTTIDVSWSGATDTGGSGVAGYSYLFDTSATTLPDEISEGIGTSTTSSILTDGNSHYFHLRTIDNAGNWTSTVHKGPFYIDTTNPTVPIASPPAGDYSSHQSVVLSSTDTTSGVASIYYTTDGSTPNNTKSLYTTPVSVDNDLTLKAITYDNAGNVSGILTAVYGIAPIISVQSSSTLSGTSAVVSWTTDILATSRVIYDSVSHGVLGAAPNYGYPNSTTEDPSKVFSHSVTISGLSDGTTYYYRTISHGSPEAVGEEKNFGTFSRPSGVSGGGGGGGGGGAAAPSAGVVAGVSGAFAPATFNTNVLGAATPGGELASSTESAVLGEKTSIPVVQEKNKPQLSKKYVFAFVTGLLLLLFGFLAWKKRNT